MKNFKVFTIAALMASAAFTFTSCGGGEKTETEEKEKINLDEGIGHVQQLIGAFESGDIKIDKSTNEDITKYFDFKDSGEEYLSDDKDFKGYRLDKQYTLADEVLNSVSYSTFYDEGEDELAEKDSEKVLEYLKKTLGKSEGSGDTYFKWTKSKYEVSYNIFSDGYSLYVKSFIEKDDYDPIDDVDVSTGECAPDFYALRDELVNKVITNIANGKIKIGKTTKEEIADLTGDGADFNHDYKGMNVSGYFSYTGGVLTSFSFNYFYTCEAATSLLSLDKSELGTDISTELNVESKTDGTGENAGKTWKIKGQTLQQSNFSDGYAFYFN